MSLVIKHKKTSGIPDGDDDSVIRPSDWNDEHTVEGGVPSDFQAPILNGGYYSCPLMFPTQDTPTADVLLAAPFWASFDVTWTKIGISVVTPEAGAKVRLGVYASNTANRPGALLLDAGEVDCSTAGNKEIDISLAIPANTLVWLASVTQTTGETLVAWLGSGDTGQIGSWGAVVIGAATAEEAFSGIDLTRSFAYGPLPDPFGDIDSGSQFCPLPYLRSVT